MVSTTLFNDDMDKPEGVLCIHHIRIGFCIVLENTFVREPPVGSFFYLSLT